MGVPRFDASEEEIRRWVNQIAVICLSEEFQRLKSELEAIYAREKVENFQIQAFQDALYAFIAQEEEKLSKIFRA